MPGHPEYFDAVASGISNDISTRGANYADGCSATAKYKGKDGKCVAQCPEGSIVRGSPYWDCQSPPSQNPPATTTPAPSGFVTSLETGPPAGTAAASPCFTECQAKVQQEQTRCADIWQRVGWSLSKEGCPATLTPQPLSSGCGEPTAASCPMAATSCPYATQPAAPASCPYAPPSTTQPASSCGCQR